MTTGDPVQYDGLTIEYGRMGEEDLLSTMLSVAEHKGLLKWLATTEDCFYLISVEGRRFPLLTADEVRGAVIAIAFTAGDGLDGLSYRKGLAGTEHPHIDSVDRVPHER